MYSCACTQMELGLLVWYMYMYTCMYTCIYGFVTGQQCARVVMQAQASATYTCTYCMYMNKSDKNMHVSWITRTTTHCAVDGPTYSHPMPRCLCTCAYTCALCGNEQTSHPVDSWSPGWNCCHHHHHHHHHHRRRHMW